MEYCKVNILLADAKHIFTILKYPEEKGNWEEELEMLQVRGREERLSLGLWQGVELWLSAWFLPF